jgi:hypothetical protein
MLNLQTSLLRFRALPATQRSLRLESFAPKGGLDAENPIVRRGDKITLRKWPYSQPIVVCARQTNFELRLPRDGLKGSFCPSSSCVRGVVLSATSDGICPHSNDGRQPRTPGDKAPSARGLVGGSWLVQRVDGTPPRVSSPKRMPK